MQKLPAAIAEVEAEDDDFVDPHELSSCIDRLQAKPCRVVAAATRRGDHLLAGQTPSSWVAARCQISKTSAADRLCVGEQLQNLPKISQALQAGQIGYQAAAVICHLSEQIGEKRRFIEEDDWIGFARTFSIKELRYLTHEARVRWDCESFDRDAEEDFELRSFDISETLGGMYRVDGWLDPVGGAALKAAIDALAKPLGAEDARSGRQRRADAVVELAHHVMDQGRLPKRHGVRPHVSVHTTIEALRGELGAEVAQLEGGMPVSSKTVQRLACDGSLHRVLQGRLQGHRRRPGPAHSPAGAVAGPEGEAPDLRLAGLRPAAGLVQRPPCRLLEPGRQDQPAADAPALPLPPSPGPRGWLAGGDGR